MTSDPQAQQPVADILGPPPDFTLEPVQGNPFGQQASTLGPAPQPASTPLPPIDDTTAAMNGLSLSDNTPPAPAPVSGQAAPSPPAVDDYGRPIGETPPSSDGNTAAYVPYLLNKGASGLSALVPPVAQSFDQQAQGFKAQLPNAGWVPDVGVFKDGDLPAQGPKVTFTNDEDATPDTTAQNTVLHLPDALGGAALQVKIPDWVPDMFGGGKTLAVYKHSVNDLLGETAQAAGYVAGPLKAAGEAAGLALGEDALRGRLGEVSADLVGQVAKTYPSSVVTTLQPYLGPALADVAGAVVKGGMTGAILGAPDVDQMRDNAVLFAAFDFLGAVSPNAGKDIAQGIQEADWYRELTIRERALAVQDIATQIRNDPKQFLDLAGADDPAVAMQIQNGINSMMDKGASARDAYNWAVENFGAQAVDMYRPAREAGPVTPIAGEEAPVTMATPSPRGQSLEEPYETSTATPQTTPDLFDPMAMARDYTEAEQAYRDAHVEYAQLQVDQATAAVRDAQTGPDKLQAMSDLREAQAGLNEAKAMPVVGQDSPLAPVMESRGPSAPPPAGAPVQYPPQMQPSLWPAQSQSGNEVTVGQPAILPDIAQAVQALSDAKATLRAAQTPQEKSEAMQGLKEAIAQYEQVQTLGASTGGQNFNPVPAGQVIDQPMASAVMASAPQGSPQGDGHDAISQQLANIYAKAPSASPYEVVRTQDELPPDVARNVQGTRIDAVYVPREDKVYYVSGNLPNAKATTDAYINGRLQSLFQHEEGGHRGIRGVFQDLYGKQWEPKLREFFEKEVLGDKTDAQIKKLLGSAYEFDLKTPGGRFQSADELFARLTEKATRGKNMNDPERTLWQRFLDYIRKWLVKLGIKNPPKKSVLEGMVQKANAFPYRESTGKGVLPQRPALYSQMEKTLTTPGMLPKESSPEGMLKVITGHVGKFKGVELDESGLKDWLGSMEPGAKVTRQDVADRLAQNRIETKDVTKEGGDTRWNRDDLVLPGGENYREVLLTLPRKASAGSVFHTNHWYEDNVLAHVRMSDRTDADGKKVLHIEEIQSDWHQKGKKEGYRTSDLPKLPDGYKLNDLDGYLFSVTFPDGSRTMPTPSAEAVINVAIDHAANVANGRPTNIQTYRERVPDAPFKNTSSWAMLAMKKMIDYAVEHGYDKIAWTPGVEQVKRYEDATRQAVDRVDWSRQGASDAGAQYTIRAYKNGQQTFSNTTDAAGLEGVLGKGMASQIVDAKEASGRLEGDQLTIGGEGMKGFYDRILPVEVNKYVKKWGSKVSETRISGSPSHDLHSFDITPEMRESVLSEGQPLYKKSLAN
jgi:hypothetical protein